MSRPKQWIKNRHKVITALVRPFLRVIIRLKYHARVDSFDQEGHRNWLILANHQTDFDQFFVSAAFKHPVYYVAMDDVFSNGFVSRFIEWAVAPIPILKATKDIKAVKNCLRIAKEGGNIALFPEGNRTYSGKTCYIKPSVAALAQKLGLPIAIFRIEGGYGVKPRWADNIRNGAMTAGVRKIIEPQEYKDLSKEELYELICKELCVDEICSSGIYESKKSAENLERVFYVCPECGLSEFTSAASIVSCTQCGKRYKYLPNLRLKALDGQRSFDTIADWYDYQENFVRNLDLTKFGNKNFYVENVDLYKVVVCVDKQLMQRSVQLKMYNDCITMQLQDGLITLYYDDILAVACINDHKLNIIHKDDVYQIQGNKGFNALKYCNIYYRYKYMQEEHLDGEFQFLGL